jgi:hypothetical protein
MLGPVGAVAAKWGTVRSGGDGGDDVFSLGGGRNAAAALSLTPKTAIASKLRHQLERSSGILGVTNLGI